MERIHYVVVFAIVALGVSLAFGQKSPKDATKVAVVEFEKPLPTTAWFDPSVPKVDMSKLAWQEPIRDYGVESFDPPERTESKTNRDGAVAMAKKF